MILGESSLVRDEVELTIVFCVGANIDVLRIGFLRLRPFKDISTLSIMKLICFYVHSTTRRMDANNQ